MEAFIRASVHLKTSSVTGPLLLAHARTREHGCLQRQAERSDRQAEGSRQTDRKIQ